MFAGGMCFGLAVEAAVGRISVVFVQLWVAEAATAAGFRRFGRFLAQRWCA